MPLGRLSSGHRHADETELCCSFCRKGQNAVGKLISNPSGYPRVYICDECIRVCCFILDEDKAEVSFKGPVEPTSAS